MTGKPEVISRKADLHAITSGLPTIRPESRFSLPTTPFRANFQVPDNAAEM